MIAIDYTSRQPITAQIRDQMVRLITSGALKPGDWLPSVRQLATDLSINPNTIQKAYSEMELRGIIVDVSHLNDAGFKDVCATATQPFAASHSNARAVCGHPRNLADWQLRELADRYKEAQVAIEVGKVFDTEKSIINYENLGIGRIIYQLPTTLCEMFLSEVFKKNPIEALDPDTLETINKFFENNLNVSETSRKLYVHRNTLVYRLEKIKKITGLDLREFDHAIVFKVAMMVKKYLDTQNTSKY